MDFNNIKFSNVLTKEDYEISHDLPEKFRLSTSVISYFTGDTWKCVSLLTILKHLVLHDEFVDIDNNNTKHNISLIICPITLLSCVVDGILYPKKVEDGMIVFEDEKKNEFNFFTSEFKKREVEIKKIRNIFTDHPDAHYIIPKKQNFHNNLILPKQYYKNLLDYNGKKIDTNNLAHPKSLVYLIEYQESSTNKKKYTTIIGKSVDTISPKGYNGEISGIENYLRKHGDEMRYKNGFVYQILFYVANSKFSDKTIKL